jgi:cell division protein FtsB
MSIVRAMRRRAHVVVDPILGIALTGYFAYHLVEGERGFKAWLRLNGEIRTATANLEAVRAQRAALEVKVSNLRPEHVDPDLLDERIRATLNLVSPDDIVLMQPTTSAARLARQPPLNCLLLRI